MRPYQILFIFAGMLIWLGGSPSGWGFPAQTKKTVAVNYLEEAVEQPQEKVTGNDAKLVLKLLAGKLKGVEVKEVRVDEKITGSFTGPRLREIAFLLRGSDPNPVGSIGLANDGRLVIISDGTIVVNELFGGNHILKATDLNHDGIQEIWLEGGWTHMGELATTLKIMEFKNKKARMVKDFGQVESAAQCDPENSETHAKTLTSIIYQTSETKNGWPVFQTDLYEGPCESDSGQRNPKQFRFLKTGNLSDEF